MARTLSQVLADIGAFVDQDTSAPTGTDETVRVNLIDQAQRKWAEYYDWEVLRIPNFSPTFNLSTTSLALPANFRKLLTRPTDVQGGGTVAYPEINPSTRLTDKTSDQNYCFIVGNDLIGKALVVNPALASGVSLVFDYMSFPSGLATITDVVTCPQPLYLVKEVSAEVMKSRSDPRFPSLQAEAQQMLDAMTENENTPSGAEDNRIPTWTKKTGFIIGRD